MNYCVQCHLTFEFTPHKDRPVLKLCCPSCQSGKWCIEQPKPFVALMTAFETNPHLRLTVKHVVDGFIAKIWRGTELVGSGTGGTLQAAIEAAELCAFIQLDQPS